MHDSCSSGVTWPGLCPLAIQDPFGDVGKLVLIDLLRPDPERKEPDPVH